MKELTNAEEQIMQVLWDLEKAFVKDVIELLPDPKPAYNTTSTIIRILEKKGFVGHISYGNTHQYYPLIEKEDYSRRLMNNFMKNYFSNSYQQLVSFFAKEQSLTKKEREELKMIFEVEINKQEK